MSSASEPVDDGRDVLEERAHIDLEAVEIRDDVELGGTAGEVGVPVDAICTGCSTERLKRAPAAKIDTDTESGSFEHVCHGCQKTHWYNVLAVRWDLIEIEGGDSA